jgi:hypothetical protein
LQVINAGTEPHETFDPPRIVFVPKGQVPGLGVRFVDVPVNGEWSRSHYLFAVYDNKLWPVEIESPERWYRKKLRPG